MKIATAYYPDHWPDERWERDAQLMKEAGLSFIRMGEFSWHRMEPEEGRFDFDWLQEAIQLFGKYGIKSILCTPTPTYPAWLHMKYPDIHQIKSNGQVKEFGQRQDACKNHPGFREHALRITTRLTQALGDNPYVAAWQTDNEFGCHDTARCYCQYCESTFREWLKNRFADDINSLNKAWGTFFWSQEYNCFDEISLPRDTADRSNGTGQNPGLNLAFYRFSSDVQIMFQRELIDIIRKNSPGKLITHNLMGGYTQIDYFSLAIDLDVVSWDNYPFFGLRGRNLPPSPLNHDLMRGLKSKNVWVMEQASGAGGWDTFAPTLEPGQMRLWAYQALSRGADLVNFFRWRSSRFGTEQYWHGILYHHGIPQRRYDELKQLGSELKSLSSELRNSVVRTEIAILFDYPSMWSLEIQPHVEDGLNYRVMSERFDRALSCLGVETDVISANTDFSLYKIIIAPSQHICLPELAEQLKSFVENGGTLILGPRSGVKDEENGIVNDLLPGYLRELAGCYVEEYDAFSAIPGLSMHVKDVEGNEYQAYGLAEVLVPEGKAKSMLSYTNRYYRGRTAGVENLFGGGRCIYLGTVIEDEGLMKLIKKILGQNNIPHIPNLAKNLEIVSREKEGQIYRFYLNHNPDPITFPAVRPGIDLISGKNVNGPIKISGLDLAIVKEKNYHEN